MEKIWPRKRVWMRRILSRPVLAASLVTWGSSNQTLETISFKLLRSLEPWGSSWTTNLVTVGKACVRSSTSFGRSFPICRAFPISPIFLSWPELIEFKQRFCVGYRLQSVEYVLNQLDQLRDCLDDSFYHVLGFDKLLFQCKAFRHWVR